MHEPQDEEQDEAENGESLHGELQQGHGGRRRAAGPGVAKAPDQVDQPTDLGRASCYWTVREEERDEHGLLKRKIRPPSDSVGCQEPVSARSSCHMDAETSRGLVVLMFGSRRMIHRFVCHQTVPLVS